MDKIFKFIGYFVWIMEALKKSFDDHRMKKANEAGQGGDQREEEKAINPDEPGPSRFKYDGVFKRKREKKLD